MGYKVNDWYRGVGILSLILSIAVWYNLSKYQLISPDKMVATLQTMFQMRFDKWKVLIFIKISQKFAPMDVIDNNQALVWIMAWRRVGDKPLSEPMLTQFTDAYMWH